MPDFLKDGERFRKLSDGTYVKLDRNGEIVEDGEHIHVPILTRFTMMDTAKGQGKTPIIDLASHRPREGARPLEHRARVDAARIKSEQRQTDAWKNPPKQEIDVYSGEIAYQRSVERANTAIAKKPDDWAEPEKAWDRMRQRQENAWRGAKTKTP